MSRNRDRHIVVIGAGIAGLSAALLLAHTGCRVTLVETRPEVGGKARRVPSAAGPVDTGPTVFTMRGIFEELFAGVGESFEAHVTLTPARILARHVWPDGAALDLHADMGASEAAVEAFAGPRAAGQFRDFTARARLLFESFEAPVMRNPCTTPLGVAGAVARDMWRLIPAMAPFATLAKALGRQFDDPRLVQLFGRYATYVGGSPTLSPAILMLIWWAEASGVWQVSGGISTLARAIGDLAANRGATLRLGAGVREITVSGGRAAGVVLCDGERIAADAVLHAGDPAALSAGLLGPAVASPAKRFGERSLSACVWAFAGAPEGVALAHHTVFFGGDSAAEFDDLFRHRRFPRDPTIYVCAQDRGTGTAAPSPERLMLIMNAPACGIGGPEPEEIELCTERTFARLAASGLRLAPPQTPPMTPWDFARDYPGTQGAIYGTAPHGMMATFRRPTARTHLAGLYRAGGGAHPGPGVAMSCLSGRLAAAAILADRAST